MFTRNDNYWQNGKPYVDELIISDYPSEESQVNGLLGGEVNLINFLSSDSLAPLRDRERQPGHLQDRWMEPDHHERGHARRSAT